MPLTPWGDGCKGVPVEYVVGVLSLQIHVEYSRSLKDKRRVLRSLKDRLSKRHNIAIAEVAGQNSHRDAVVVATAVASSEHGTRRVLDAVHQDAVRVLGRSLLSADLDPWVA